jgi:acyl-CoA synthetase (AMP-forming)/AMP-acid ligase II
VSQPPRAEALEGNRLLARGADTTWGGLEPVELAPVVCCFVDGNLDAARVVRSAVAGGIELLLAGAGRRTRELVEEVRAAGFAVREPTGEVLEPTAPREATPGRIWLLTSGSTGRPKRVAHTLASLTTVTGPQPARTWLCPYAIGSYAWWQVVTLGVNQPGQDVLFLEPSELASWPRRALEAGVTAASGTPTFWRQALFTDPEALAQVPLEQVTLGGEPVDQAILTRLREVFPRARVSWIYASSEAGASIAVHDGRAGFPVEWLGSTSTGRATVRVDGDELVISSPFRGEGIDAELRTGDRVEITDGRVVVVGRLASDEINVGGAKASASEIRDVLQSHPAVLWAAVRGRKAPIVGSIVTADIVVSDPVTAPELTSWCAERLPDHAVPRRLRFLEEIPIKETLKSDV